VVGRWKVGEWMGYGCGKCGECHYSWDTVALVRDAPRKSKNLPSRGIPGRFLRLVLISPNLA